MTTCWLPFLFVLLGLALIRAAGCGGGALFDLDTKACWIRLSNESQYALTHFDAGLDSPIRLSPAIEPGQTGLVPMRFFDGNDPDVPLNESIIEIYAMERPGLLWWFLVTTTPCQTQAVTVTGEPGPDPF